MTMTKGIGYTTTHTAYVRAIDTISLDFFDYLILKSRCYFCVTGLANLSQSLGGSAKKAPPAGNSIEQLKKAARDREERERNLKLEQERYVLCFRFFLLYYHFFRTNSSRIFDRFGKTTTGNRNPLHRTCLMYTVCLSL